MKTILPKDMQIGDVVKLANVTGAYSHSTVIQREGDYVTLFRPYVSLGDFVYTGGVIPYIGTEKWTCSIHSPCEFLWLENIYRGEK